MRELENNLVLQGAFPDILWGKDIKDAPKWSEDEGIILRRKTNPNEATVEAWGVVDGQPTSKHYRVLLYDDVVVRDSVTNEDMMAKTASQMELSYNLGSVGGSRRFVGTRWHFHDFYREIIDRGTAKLRCHPGRKDGDPEGESVYWPENIHKEKLRDMKEYAYASQILLNPKADALQGFKREWLKFYTSINPSQWKKMTRYILVDSANSKKDEADFTAMWVIGLGADENYYALDILRDRLNLTERTSRLFALHRKWRPFDVRYEQYGLMADIDHIKAVQETENYRFSIREVKGQVKKDDRIGRLIPIFEAGRFYLPKSLHVTDYQKTVRDLVQDFIEHEYAAHPVGLHKDMLDSLSRIAEPDMPLKWPKEEKVVIDSPIRVHRTQSNTAWMA